MTYLSVFPQTKTDVFGTSPDCYISQSKNGLKFATSIDFFYPLVDDPYVQGQITACNVLSDLYAAGITQVDSFMTILGLSTKLSVEDRKTVAIELMRGIDNKVREAGTKIVGGQTVHNPWVTVGGSVLGIIDRPEYVVPNNTTTKGDLIVLTKPIGTQLLVNFSQYFRKDFEKREKLIKNGLSEEELNRISQQVIKSMTTLNLYGATVMNELHDSIKACTDITGFGIKGHSDNLAEIQKDSVDFKFERIPVFKGLLKHENVVRNFKLFSGLAAETSGGLMVVLDKNKAEEFIHKLQKRNNQPAWIVGEVIEGSRKSIIDAKTEFFEV